MQEPQGTDIFLSEVQLTHVCIPAGCLNQPDSSARNCDEGVLSHHSLTAAAALTDLMKSRSRTTIIITIHSTGMFAFHRLSICFKADTESIFLTNPTSKGV